MDFHFYLLTSNDAESMFFDWYKVDSKILCFYYNLENEDLCEI